MMKINSEGLFKKKKRVEGLNLRAASALILWFVVVTVKLTSLLFASLFIYTLT